jgi:hypothetical protein
MGCISQRVGTIRCSVSGAAICAARQRGEDVADVPLIALAEATGVSRSTLLRRIGGSRRALDDAVRAAGVDPGGVDRCGSARWRPARS